MDSSRISDDDFDWEAAVAEIDIACNRTSESTTTSLGSNGNFFESNCKVSKAAKQSTLDKYMRVQKDQSFSTNQNHPLLEPQSKKVDVSRHHIDTLAANTWTYPVNVPLRDYQYSIANTALFSNTLVALPTGLGKTLIAAVVMYNYFRWFPSGKIVFTAPSRPLVMQQIEACHNIVGIPQEWTIDMTGQMNPSERSEYWQKMRVFFVTPQVLEKDIQSGSCKGKELVCLVVDEAHRAVGNYSYCVVVRELMALEVDLRILALTATPGSKQASIQTVIDNLNISTLEHRDETDPDVVEYTHNRNIDLIPVTMPKESLNISSLLLSIVEPVVQKLCSLRVFYNRDLTKITPFELLTARDKFRQSPPSFISELQYGEIEGYFGTAVTLYHIYKLLFSHGVRPALEMLHQKLQPGAFARTMGRNEKVWQLKLSMQQNLKHGAPNPKLQKMEEIIKEHFDSNNPATTRVIIFTNFRESVKDIIESLQKLETGVKAVEFIGQSSGKACKGQTQKMQQEVLQKFRAGEFNIIVATSIGEEGLDIMEVDLVICFDANVSPIRMIQRIGRTGRKRDGRVVILASEGSELQGYMTKKAKGKALRKHMHNGGIQSFIFHSSPRMVPHCYQPQAELIEMSIEKFVPRRNKAKAISISKDSVTDSLTEAEANLLAKYFSGERDQHGWKPSLVAFPHCQLFPSRVAKIKHSFRTSEMLVHTLKLLQGQDISKVESQPRNSLDSAEYAVKDFVSQGLQDDDFEFSASLEPYPLYCIPDKTDVEEAENSFIAMEEDRLPNSFRKEVISLDELDTVTGEEVITLKELDTVTRREVIHLKELDTVKNKELKGAHSSEMEKAKTNSSFLKTPVLHHCLFNTQYVYVNEEGRVIIKPPPSLPIHKKLATKKADILSDSKNRAPQDVATYSLPVRSFVGEQAGVMLTENKDNSEEFMNKPSCADKITIGLQNYSLQEPVIDRMHDPYNSTNSQNFPTEKLDEMQHCKTNNNVDKMVGSFEQFGVCSPPRDNQEKNTQKNTRFSRPDNMLSGKPLEDSPKLPSKSLKVISGASRINKESALSDCNGNSVSFGSELKENVVSNCAPDSNGSLLFGHIHGNSDLRNPISNSVLKDSTNHQRRDSRLQRKPSLDDSFLKYDGKMLSAADNIDVSISQMETRNTISNNISYICNNSNDSGVKRSSTYSIEDERQGAVLEALSTPRVSALHTQISPLTIKNTCTQDWRLSIDETQQSGKKQRKFKRLRKVKEDAQKPSSKKNTKKDQHNTDSLVYRKQRISTDRGIPKRTNLPLIDEEAEVSSDEDVSTDEDNESENGSAEETDDSFIDDEIELSTSESDKVDMLAVYRRSLLTQSPFDRNINASVCIENMRDDGNEEQEPPISVDPPFDTVCSSGSETMETPYHASFSEDVKCESSSKDLNISYHSRFNVHIQSESGKTDIFQELRKRKLDFQSINVTESSDYQGNFSCPANASSIKDVYSQPKHTSEDLISASLDDDFFTGIDLDALEAEATEKARLRSQMNVGYQQAASITEPGMPGMPKIGVSFPRSQGVDLQSIVNNCSYKNQTIALDENNDFVNNGFPRKRERTEDVDNDFLCIPSFNLGI